MTTVASTLRRTQVLPGLTAPPAAGSSHPANCPVCRALEREIASFRGGRCWRAQVTLGERIGRSERTVRRHLRALEAAELVETTRRGLTKTNVYRLTPEPRKKARPNGPRRVRSDAAKMADDTTHLTVCSLKKQTPASAAQAPRDASPRPPKAEAPDPARLERRERLTAAGVSPRRATNLVATFPLERLDRQLEWLPFRHAQNPGALLATAIAEDWAEPAVARIQRAQRAAAEAALEREAAAQEREAEATQREAEEERHVDIGLATLAPTHLAELQADAERTIRAEFLRFMWDTEPFAKAVQRRFRRSVLAALPLAAWAAT